MVFVESPAMSTAPASDFGDRLLNAYAAVRDRLLQSRNAHGFWEGFLSSSALSTATATSALALARDPADTARIASGVAWLASSQNADGGWGDTTDSPSNLATTLLTTAALTLTGDEGRTGALEKAKEFLRQKHGVRASTHPASIVEAVQREYGEDRTFAVPILMNCALAGLVEWRDIPGLPFELAVLPHAWYKAVRLHVVSYALPALIAIGLLIDRRNPPTSRMRRLLRKIVLKRVLKKLQNIQPDHGGFLEATPLTSFVAMALLPPFGREQHVAAKCLEFLRMSQRSDGAWPIDTNLSVWLTTAAVSALDAGGELSRIDRGQTARWIAAAQYSVRHPYTNAEPGGWAWTDLPGGVPDVDDTSGAILALMALGNEDSVVKATVHEPRGTEEVVGKTPSMLPSPSLTTSSGPFCCVAHRGRLLAAGVGWLLDVQNSDGGWPTFCRGWGRLPFDRSAPDLTAHALRALTRAASIGRSPQRAIRRGLQYLGRSQEADGSWLPLWFGNQSAAGRTNPVVGTARVLRALEILAPDSQQAAKGVEYLLRSQNADGGWGGATGVASSIEETGLAVAALTGWSQTPTVHGASVRGVEYLLQSHADRSTEPVPIGLYFARLWYSERLYPLIWSLDAIGRFIRIAHIPPAAPAGEGRPG
jgi:squalene-hopene/tetraprenyl-beta-curcumene cyclase